MNSITQSERKTWVDMGKGISMTLVMLFHSETLFSQPDIFISPLFAFFRMPFFFFLSGYLFTSNPETFNLKKKTLQILRGIVWTYLIFTSILLIPKALSDGYSFTLGFKDILLGWASWFVVVLGVAQIIFALILSKTKNLKTIFILILCSLIIGFISNKLFNERLPFYFNRVSIVFFFFGLGFMYRRYEYKLNKYLKVGLKPLILSIIIFYSIYIFDSIYLQTESGIADHPTNNYPLFVIYALIGIVMMIQLSKILPYNKYIAFIGINSLVFYYLNNGVIKILAAILNKFNIDRSLTSNFIGSFIMLLLCSTIIYSITLLLKKYCPIIVGNKDAFNKMSKILHLNIKF